MLAGGDNGKILVLAENALSGTQRFQLHAAMGAGASAHGVRKVMPALPRVSALGTDIRAVCPLDVYKRQAHATERNYGFNTAVGGTAVSEKNTLSACINGAQSVTDGQAVKLRLLEPMAVADRIIPRNAALVGAAQ